MSKLDPCLKDARAFAKLRQDRPGERLAPKRSASDHNDALSELAKQNQQPGESLAAAYARILETEEGGLLYDAHRAAMRAEELGQRAANRVA